jgi:hypothetical protein
MALHHILDKKKAPLLCGALIKLLGPQEETDPNQPPDFPMGVSLGFSAI